MAEVEGGGPGGGLSVPAHVAIIMDGNGRWATQRGLRRIEGHRAGEEAITDVVRASSEWGMEALTLFAFSTENWRRPRDEVEFLMSFNRDLLKKRVDEFHQRDIMIRFLGRRNRIPRPLLKQIDKARKKTKDNSGMRLNVAFNYGGRAELVDAFKSMVVDIDKGNLKLRNIDEDVVSSYLYAPDVPDPDLMIRTAGEMRISNFLLWELAYTELYVTQVLWPDFRREHLREAIEEYDRRVRKFGDIGKESDS